MAAAQEEAGLRGHTAAAGSGGSRWQSQECSAPSMSRVLIPCCVAERRSGRTLTAFRRAGWPGGSGTGGEVGGSTYRVCTSARAPRSSGPAGATLEDRLACFARRARRPSRCHAERLTWSTALSGLDGQSDRTTNLEPGLICSASAVVTQAQTFNHSIFHSQG